MLGTTHLCRERMKILCVCKKKAKRQRDTDCPSHVPLLLSFFSPSICLFSSTPHLPVYLPLSTWLPISFSGYLSICLSATRWLAICLAVRIYSSISPCLSVYLSRSIYLSIHHALSICLPVYVSRSICLSVRITLCLFVCLALSADVQCRCTAVWTGTHGDTEEEVSFSREESFSCLTGKLTECLCLCLPVYLSVAIHP